jgi:hypothetical protein
MKVGDSTQNGIKIPPVITTLTGLLDTGLIRMYAKFERALTIARSLIAFISTIY